MQQYLLPIWATAAPGAFGSVWQTEWTVSNNGTTTLSILAPLCPFGSLCPVVPMIVEPNAEKRPVLYPQAPAPNLGIFVSVPTDQASSFATELRVRDLSQQSASWGAELPVVNTTEFRNSIRLLDVPADPNFRVLLRIYGLSSSAGPVHVRVQKPDGTALLEQTIRLLLPQSSFAPSYAQLPIPAGVAGDRLRIDLTTVASDQPVWAFVSVTNDTTQELTLITPQPIPKPAASTAALPFGHWSGSRACLDVTSTTTTLVDPRGDTISFITPTVDANGHFETDGQLLPCNPGPALQPVTVHIIGDVRGGTVTITVGSPQTPDPMTLELGSKDVCPRCILV